MVFPSIACHDTRLRMEAFRVMFGNMNNKILARTKIKFSPPTNQPNRRSAVNQRRPLKYFMRYLEQKIESYLWFNNCIKIKIEKNTMRCAWVEDRKLISWLPVIMNILIRLLPYIPSCSVIRKNNITYCTVQFDSYNMVKFKQKSIW